MKSVPNVFPHPFAMRTISTLIDCSPNFTCLMKPFQKGSELDFRDITMKLKEAADHITLV